MAAGRNDVSRRRGSYSYSKKEYDRYRNGSRVLESSRGHVRCTNGYHYSSCTSDSSQQGGFSVLEVDQELVASGSCVEDGEIAKFENEVRVVLEKKRKISPVVWEREEKEVRISSKNRIVQCRLSTSPTSLPKSTSVVLDGSDQIDPLTADQPQDMETSSIKPPIESLSGGSTVSECSPDSSSPLSQGQCGGDGQEEEQMEEEEFVETRNILMSRWASESDSPSDTCVSDDEGMPKRKKMNHHRDVSPLLDMQQMSSPECGEILREGSEEYRSRSFGSVSPVSGEEYSDDELDKIDDVEIDDKHNADDVISQFESHLEDDNDGNQNHPDTVPKRSINMLQSCRSVFDYEKLNKINEGTYGVVYRARDKQTGEIVALKKIKMGVERDGGFPLSALREMNILLSFHHPSIVNVKEVVMGDLDSVFMVMEYMEHDLKGMIGVMKQPFSASEVKCLMLQLLEGVKYLHDNWVLHRDLKSSNLLMNNRGDLKICDFGLSRQYGSPLKPYTPLVVTMWYRAPELLLGLEQYSTAIDMWSVGCIMAEMLSKAPLFQGKSEVDQLDKIFRTLGTPDDTIWPGLSKLPGASAKFVKQPYNQLRKKFPAASFTGSPVLSESGFDLLSKLLTYDPEERITADAALNHDWFREVPLPKCKDFMPTFPAQNVQDRCRNR